MPKPSKQKHAEKAAASIKDDRFASFESNPRYKLPSTKRTKTTVDKRFSRMLKDDDFTATAKVDKYGRKLKSDNKKKALQRLYKDEDEDDDEGSVENDDVVQQELEKANKSYDPARGGGFSSSESDTDSDDEEEEDESEEAEVDTSASVNRLRDAQADVETGDVTKRIAIVNLDWDHIKSSDLMALFSSFAPKGGRIERVSIYPSEFGKERMQREELEGPPREIFKKKQDSDDDKEEEESESESKDDSDDEDEDEKIRKDIIEEGDDQDFDSDALRSYQLDRLRYYYAVMVCSDAATAEKIYHATDGTEYQTSSNFLDLRFVPDEVEFDDDPRDECTEMPSDYKPTEFVTDALQHSKVKLTWDMHPEEAARKEDIKRAFTGSRADLEENDLKAYLASDSEDDGEPLGGNDAADGEESSGLSKKELKAQRMRALLGLGAEPAGKSSKSAPVGDMEITFTPGLMDDGSRKKKKADPEEETTIEKYKRREKERKARKKELALQKRNDNSEAAGDGDDGAQGDGAEDDLGFDDPFFTTDAPSKTVSKHSKKKEERLKKREAKAAEEAENAAQRKKLERIMAEDRDDNDEHLDHFNIKEIARAEKLKGKKSKKHKKAAAAAAEGELQDGFQMDVADDRFGAVFGDHKFAIDPSHPQFKATPGMKKLLEEGRKKRKNEDHDFPAEVPRDEDGSSKKKKKQKTEKAANDDLASLVESVRRKANSKR